MLKLKENYPLIVCFAHRLYSSVANAFNDIIQTDKDFANVHKALIELTTWVNRASNIKNQFFPRIKQGRVTRPWRSIYDLYHSVKLNYDEIKSILYEKDKLDLLIHLKKDLIEETEELMEIYNSAFNTLETKNCSLHLVLPTYYTIINYLNALELKNTYTKELKIKLVHYLQLKYYGSITDFHILAPFLHPCFHSLTLPLQIHKEENIWNCPKTHLQFSILH